MSDDYDLVVLGSGPAGERGALEAARLGKRVLVVERAAEPGGAAVHTGTLPSKTLRETAMFLSGREHREVYGVNVSLDADLFRPKLLSRKATVKRLEVERIQSAFARAGVETLRGTGKLVAADEVEVETASGARRIRARFVLLATGSIPHRPPEVPWSDPDVEDSDTILVLDRMPASLTVLGAGVIGCEYASIFAALGVKVTLVDRKDELLAFLDRDMSEALRVAFVAMGIDVRLKDAASRIERRGNHLAVDLESGHSLRADKLLFCGGRSGATRGLGLEEVGVKLGTRGSVVVDPHYRTSVPSVLAAGDVIGFPALASTSMEQGRLAVMHAFGAHEVSDEVARAAAVLPYGVYTIPEVSCVGLSEEDAIARGEEVVVGRGDFEHNARAKINGFAFGFVKLVFCRRTRKLLGAHAIGDRATELIHVGQAMVALGGTVDVVSHMVINYPTLSECFKHAAEDALLNWPA